MVRNIEEEILTEKESFEVANSILYENSFNTKNTRLHKTIRGNAEITPIEYLFNRDNFIQYIKRKRLPMYRIINQGVTDLTVDYFLSKLKKENILELHEELWQKENMIEYNNIPKIRTIIDFQGGEEFLEGHFPKQSKKYPKINFEKNSINILWDRYLWKDEPYFNMMLEEALFFGKRFKEKMDYHEIPFN